MIILTNFLAIRPACGPVEVGLEGLYWSVSWYIRNLYYYSLDRVRPDHATGDGIDQRQLERSHVSDARRGWREQGQNLGCELVPSPAPQPRPGVREEGSGRGVPAGRLRVSQLTYVVFLAPKFWRKKCQTQIFLSNQPYKWVKVWFF